MTSRGSVRLAIVVAAALAAAALRIAVLPVQGSTDVPYFRVWARYAASEGVGRMYGTGGRFPERRLLEDRGVRTKTNYPPVALWELGIAARVANAATGAQAGDRALTIAIKALVVFAEAGLALLLLAAVSTVSTRDVAALAALRLWLDPGAILIGSVLGYLEPLYLLPAMAAIVASARGRPAAAGALFAVAMLTKPIAILFMPAIAAGVWHASGGSAQGLWRAMTAGAIVAAAAVAPVAVQGGLLNMSWAVGSPLRDPLLTGNATNLWWLVGALATPPLEPSRVAGAVAACATIAWAFTRMRRAADAAWLAAGAALAVHAYAVLAVSVHENYLFAAVPPLVLAAAGRPRFRDICAAVSAISFLNLGLTSGADAFAASPLLAPITALTAVSNCAALAWHAVVFDRESRA
jgi:hypothetical protein